MNIDFEDGFSFLLPSALFLCLSFGGGGGGGGGVKITGCIVLNGAEKLASVCTVQPFRTPLLFLHGFSFHIAMYL